MRSDLYFAPQLAARLHAGQTDKQGQPYFSHLARVAARVLTTGRLDLVPAAYLHDALEDTPCTAHTLAVCRIDSTTIAIVERLTRVERAEPFGREPYASYIERVSQSESASIVKLADLLDNLSRQAGLSSVDRDSLSPRYRGAILTLLDRWPGLAALYPEARVGLGLDPTPGGSQTTPNQE